MPHKRVLIIDDEKNMCHMLQVMLQKGGYKAESAMDGKKGLELMECAAFDFVLCDLKMPKMDGMTFLQNAREIYPDKTYIMMSAYGTMDNAIEAMKGGAYDYISKPFKQDEVLLTLKKAEERERLKEENLELKSKIKEIDKKYSFENIIARSEAMTNVFDLIRKVADHKTTVLLIGESGTGKELLAKAVHNTGGRNSVPMVALNCGSIPENLIESELFGYKKGAFTDARADKRGFFEEADGGTLFLDEIAELPLPMQVKLLRVLQEEEITPLGATKPKKINVRVITATSRDLSKEVEEGRFRSDLFYRINVMNINIPPLRERRGDIPLLIGYYINLFNKKLGKSIEGLSSQAMSVVMGHPWPGNVRELENAIERSVLLTQGSLITPDDLPSNITSDTPLKSSVPEDTLSIKKATKILEKDLIIKALDLTEGNKTKACEILEISRPILISKIKDFGIKT